MTLAWALGLVPIPILILILVLVLILILILILTPVLILSLDQIQILTLMALFLMSRPAFLSVSFFFVSLLCRLCPGACFWGFFAWLPGQVQFAHRSTIMLLQAGHRQKTD